MNFLVITDFDSDFLLRLRRSRWDYRIPCRPCTWHRCSSDKSNNPGNYACDRL